MPEVTENFVRIPVSNKKFSRIRTITISTKEGIKALIGVLPGKKASQIKTYLFDRKKWTMKKARAWIAAHKKSDGLGTRGKPRKGKPKTSEERKKTHKAKFGTSKLPKRGTGLNRYDSVLIKKLKGLASAKDRILADKALIEKLNEQANKKRMVNHADSIGVKGDAVHGDEWTETAEGVTFHNVVFTKEMVQNYSNGKHYKPASELKKALDSLRGKPVTAYAHPRDKVVTNMAQQVGYIVFDSVKYDEKQNRSYGDVFLKKEKKNEQIIKDTKAKKLEEVSVGFRCEEVHEPGEFNGQHYDIRQENMFYDHLALVMQGRAGVKDGVGLYAF